MRIIHLATRTILAENVREARTFWTRFMGLMFVNSVAPYDGLFLSHTNSIHNSFVRFALDVLFIDDEGRVIKILRNFRPWRFSLPYFRARHVIELPAGKLPDFVKEQDLLLLDPPA